MNSAKILFKIIKISIAIISTALYMHAVRIFLAMLSYTSSTTIDKIAVKSERTFDVRIDTNVSSMTCFLTLLSLSVLLAKNINSSAVAISTSISARMPVNVSLFISHPRSNEIMIATITGITIKQILSQMDVLRVFAFRKTRNCAANI